jgi:uncharacterized protein
MLGKDLMSETTAEPARIQSLDVVRGLAVLGILAVNALYFDAPWSAVVNPLLPPIALTPETHWTWLLMHVVFELKMVTLFSMLFGASIYLVGGETDDAERGVVLRRRLAWMLLFGIVHGALIWAGDILLTYAMAGFVVMFARSWPAARLMLNGLIVFALVVIAPEVWSALTPLDADALRNQAGFWAPPPENLARTVGAYQHDGARENFNGWVYLTLNPFTLIFVARTVGVMMVGMALLKWGFWSGRWPVWRYVLVTAIGAVALALVAWQARINLEQGFEVEHMSRFGLAANETLSPLISLSYAGALIVLVRAGALRLATNALAAVGRMAFTNYIAQSVIMSTIFYGGRGFGLYGEVDRVTLWGIVVAVWIVQLIWSTLWLKRFQMGPLEWTWRRLSYARPVAIAR